MKKYEFRPDVAIADIAFYAYGRTYSELFEHACEATTAAMADFKKIEEKTEKIIEKNAGTTEELLYAVLEEIIFLKDAEQLIFRSFHVDALSETAPFRIRMTAKGELIDREKHGAHADVKAVTMQDFKVEKLGDMYRASVTLDI